MTAPTGVILAGGASSRMGTDKAFVEIDGRPMVLRVADALRAGGCEPVWCQGGDPVRLAALGLDARPDDAGSARPGPVRAIASALAAATAPTVVVAACDLPALTGDLVRALVGTSIDEGRVAVAVADGRRHLVAAWPVASRTHLQDAIDRGVASYGGVLAELVAVEIAADPDAVRNVNRPRDLPDQRSAQR